LMCPRCRSVLMYLNQDGDKECANCGHVVYIMKAPLTLEDLAEAQRGKSRIRGPRHGVRGREWL
jgi:uncharacterized Zn finger protein (UPF0148 family)